MTLDITIEVLHILTQKVIEDPLTNARIEIDMLKELAMTIDLLERTRSFCNAEEAKAELSCKKFEFDRDLAGKEFDLKSKIVGPR